MRMWSLTALREELIKIGAKVVRHAKYAPFQMTEVAVPREDRETRQNSRGEPEVPLSPGVTHKEHATIGDSTASVDTVPTPREPGLPPHVLEMIRRLYGVDLEVKGVGSEEGFGLPPRSPSDGDESPLLLSFNQTYPGRYSTAWSNGLSSPSESCRPSRSPALSVRQ